MNADKAKQLDFRILLEKLGYHPVQGGIKKGGSEIWYHSPFNKSDKSPSFHISRGRKVAWVFKCFSTGEEGTIIDFVNVHEGYSPHDIKPALAYLRGKFPGSLLDYKKIREGDTNNPTTPFSFHKQSEIEQKGLVADRDLEYIEDLPLKSGTLLGYLENERKIPQSLAQKYLRLVRYKNLKKQKSYYAIGMKNRAGGFEVRAASDTYNFKSALITRDITVIKGKDKFDSILVFEGMTDFLSYLVMTETDHPSCHVVVMHSVNSYARCKAFMDQNDFRYIHTFLDNDKTGEKYTARFIADFEKKVLSHSSKFSSYKDLNEALKAGVSINFFGDIRKQNLDFEIS